MILPKPQSPPVPLQIQWTDAASDHNYEGSGTEAGYLVEMSQVGYHIRNGHDDRLGEYIVLVVDWCFQDGEIAFRDWTAVPAGWITKIEHLIPTGATHASPPREV